MVLNKPLGQILTPDEKARLNIIKQGTPQYLFINNICQSVVDNNLKGLLSYPQINFDQIVENWLFEKQSNRQWTMRDFIKKDYGYEFMNPQDTQSFLDYHNEYSELEEVIFGYESNMKGNNEAGKVISSIYNIYQKKHGDE